YLSSRSRVVALQGFNSNEHPTDTGLPQGSILGPTLFNALVIFILKQTVTIGTKLHAYADDLVLISNELVHDSLQKDPRVFPPTNWALKAAVIQNDFEIPIIHPPLVQPKPPFEGIISRDHPKKDNPVATLNAANSRIKNLSDPNTRIRYTDGSQHATGNTGWSAYSHKESSISGRLPRFTPITLTELTTLLETLRWCRTNRTLHQRIVINTDSMAALLILQTPPPQPILKLPFKYGMKPNNSNN
ncbi:hypothetical protein LSH36_200g04053, partial [Paralvinella palmiformis]